ncbi:MAG: hypothetical protein KatS3mg015_1715 [Fimbriimonadales bacterium]|nr:MAG: hypothetical protein KatS3mg015_1715 [Fimbriimonadales bacterium]
MPKAQAKDGEPHGRISDFPIPPPPIPARAGSLRGPAHPALHPFNRDFRPGRKLTGSSRRFYIVMRNAVADTTSLLFQARRYRQLWSRVSAPLKVQLSGLWYSQGDSPGHILRVDSRGRFQIENLGSGVNVEGVFEIVPRNGKHFVTFLDEVTEGGTAAELVEIAPNRMRLRWLDSGKETVYQKPADDA